MSTMVSQSLYPLTALVSRPTGVPDRAGQTDLSNIQPVFDTPCRLERARKSDGERFNDRSIGVIIERRYLYVNGGVDIRERDTVVVVDGDGNECCPPSLVGAVRPVYASMISSELEHHRECVLEIKRGTIPT